MKYLNYILFPIGIDGLIFEIVAKVLILIGFCKQIGRYF